MHLLGTGIVHVYYNKHVNASFNTKPYTLLQAQVKILIFRICINNMLKKVYKDLLDEEYRM